MQTTLLGIAIALILALLAALVGPHFIEWNQYRGQFAAQASRVTGLTVDIKGPIEARLLPTPMLTLTRVEVTQPGEAATLRARSLGIEFSLSALLRGELRAAEMRIEGAEFAGGLDEQGRLVWPTPAIGVDVDTTSIERLDLVDGRAILSDAGSGNQLVLDKLEFRGELRSLLGPVKGEGSFVLGGLHYPYRISASRAGEGGARVVLNIDPIDRPLLADADVLIAVERGVPRFDGTLQVARAVGRAPDGIIQPWRVSSRVRGDSGGAILEQIEFQYGTDDRAVRLRGDANLYFGRTPELVVGLASTQIDLDRLLGLPEATRKRPLVALKTFAEAFGGAPRPPIPVKLGISIENVTLAGSVLQRVSGEVVGTADGWDLDVLDFRAPGATQVGLSGRLNVTGAGIAFDGRAKVEARDPRTLAAWLSDRVDVHAITAGVLRAEGDVKLGHDQIAIDGLTAEIDRMTMEGRLSYSWASGERPARIEAALRAPDIDFDRAYALGQGVLADTPFEWPREGILSLKVGRAIIAGVEAQRADIDLQFDHRGLEITRLVAGDFGGAALAVKGRIDTSAQAPRGSLTLDLDARKLDGIATLIEKFAPQAAAEVRRRAVRFVPAKVQASIAVNPEAARASGPKTTFKVDGSAGGFKINLRGETDAAGEAVTIETASAQLASARLNLGGQLDAGDGSTLVELLGLDPLVAVDKRAGRLDLTASGSFNGDIAVDGRLVAGGLDVSAKGTVRVAGSQGPTAGVVLRVVNANLRSTRPVTGRPAETLPISLAANLALAESVINLTDIAGKAAGTDVGGRLKIGLAQPVTIDGDVEVAEVNLPAVIAAVTGTPSQSGAAPWPAEPFEQGLLRDLSGQVKVRSAHVALTPRLAAKNVRGLVHLHQSELSFEDIDGTLAGGRVAGEMSFHRGGEGMTANARLRFAGADLAELIRGGPPPLAGHLTANIEVEGTGRSPVALMGSLRGHGSFTLQDGRIQRLDPAAFDTVIRNADLGMPIDVPRIRERMEQALAAGALAVPLAEGEIAVADGQARLANTMVRAQGADLAVGGSVVLTEHALDARLVLSGSQRADAATRPEVTLTLRGPVEAPRATLDVAAFSNWLALRAVEQQSKRIDALESGRELPVNPAREPEARGSSATGRIPSQTQPLQPAQPQQLPQPRPRSTTTQSTTTQPAASPSPAPSGPSAGQSRPAPQPLDVRPPGSRGSSLLESLFGR